MIVYLGDYPGAAKNREHKFKRAVESFLENDFLNKELIVVSDGCKKSYDIYCEFFQNEKNIKFILAPKQPAGYPGFLRQIGIYFSKGETISYLDSDDYLDPEFISNLKSNFDQNPEAKMLYYDSLLVDSLREFVGLKEIINDNIIDELKNFRWTILPTSLNSRGIGTTNIAHRRMDQLKWENWDGITGLSEDWGYIKQWIDLELNIKKVVINKYYLCHFRSSDPSRCVDV
jgi:glycosyltransferase involved in cell wall biosynthesis